MEMILQALPVLMVVVVASIVVLIIYVSHRNEKRRQQEMKNLADELGFQLLPMPPDGIYGQLKQFELLRRGRRNQASSWMQRSTGDVDAMIFDHQYTTGGGKNSHTHRQTVVAIRSAQLQLPRFSISPEHLLVRIASALGYQDIDLDSAPDFSKKFLLRGPDEIAIRERLRSVNLDRLADFTGLSLEAAQDTLLVWYAGKRPKPADVRAFFETAFEVYVLFKDNK